MEFTEKISGIITRPEKTIKEISEKPYIEEAVLIVGLAAIISGISGYLMSNKIILDFGDLDVSGMGVMQLIIVAATIITPLIYVIILWIIGAGVVHLVSVALGGEGTFRQMLVIYGYCQVPIIISVAVGAVLLSFIEPITISVSPGAAQPDVTGMLMSNIYYQVSYIVSILMKLWSVGLVYIGVKIVHELSNGKALIAVLIPLLFLVFGIILTVFSSLIFGQFQ